MVAPRAPCQEKKETQSKEKKPNTNKTSTIKNKCKEYQNQEKDSINSIIYTGGCSRNMMVWEGFGILRRKHSILGMENRFIPSLPKLSMPCQQTSFLMENYGSIYPMPFFRSSVSFDLLLLSSSSLSLFNFISTFLGLGGRSFRRR